MNINEEEYSRPLKAKKPDGYTLLPTVIKQLDTWIESSEEIAEILRKAGMPQQAQTHTDYAQSYWNVKQFIEVNGGYLDFSQLT